MKRKSSAEEAVSSGKVAILAFRTRRAWTFHVIFECALRKWRSQKIVHAPVNPIPASPASNNCSSPASRSKRLCNEHAAISPFQPILQTNITKTNDLVYPTATTTTTATTAAAFDKRRNIVWFRPINYHHHCGISPVNKRLLVKPRFVCQLLSIATEINESVLMAYPPWPPLLSPSPDE